MARFNNRVYEEERTQYTRNLRHHFLRVQDGYEGYGEFNALPVRWFNIDIKKDFHNPPYGQGISPSNILRPFTTICISSIYSFLDQFWDINEHEYNTAGVCAMHAGQVVQVSDDRVIPETTTFDLVYSGMHQSPRTRRPTKMNQYMINQCENNGVVLVVVSNPARHECKVLGFYEGVGYDTNGPRDQGHPHRFFLRRIVR